LSSPGTAIGGFKASGKGVMSRPPNLAPNKFQKRPSKIQENLLAPRTPLGELTALPRAPSWWGEG